MKKLLILILFTANSYCMEETGFWNQLKTEWSKIKNKNLIDAVKAENPALVKQLINSGNYNVNVDVDGYGMTILMQAAINGNLEIVKELIKKGANVNAQSNPGYTALMWAAHFGRYQIAKELIKAGADINAKTHAGQTALDMAKLMQNANLIALLEE